MSRPTSPVTAPDVIQVDESVSPPQTVDRFADLGLLRTKSTVATLATPPRCQCPLVLAPSGPWKTSGFSGPSTRRKPARPRSSRESE